MKKGFTLAEVLITLGIIGIVAAMTIPTLMANINGARYKSHFKKTLSSLNQAVRMNQANYDWNFADMDNGDWCFQDNNTTSKSICNIIKNNMTSVRMTDRDEVNEGHIFFKNRETPGSQATYILEMPSSMWDRTIGSDMDAFDLADGAIFAFIAGPTGCTLQGGTKITPNLFNAASEEEFEELMSGPNWVYDCYGFIDVNGKTGPNKEVQCSNGVTTEINPSEPCVVNKNEITDVFPVVFHNSTVEPLTNASAYVLNRAK